MRVAGIDGTAGGWVVIVLRDGIFESDRLLRPIESRLDGLADIDVIAVDVPIGFGPRAADREARALMKGAASVVFATPSQDVLQAAYGPGLGAPAQAHALGPRIAHMTGLAAEDPRIYEAHPEVSFRAMNDGLPLRNRKKSFKPLSAAARPSSTARDRDRRTAGGCGGSARRRVRRCSGGVERVEDRPRRGGVATGSARARERPLGCDLVLTALERVAQQRPLCAGSRRTSHKKPTGRRLSVRERRDSNPRPPA